MGKGIFVLGTDTDVGKTFISAGLTYVLRKHQFNACSYKPVQSGGILKENKLVSGDIEFVKGITQLCEKDSSMNTYCFKEAVSPHIAAELENVTIDRHRILQHFKELQQKYDYIIVEGAGGTVVPLIRNQYYIYDLIKDLDIPVVIVARAGVGTINHTSLTVAFIKSLGIEIKGLIINEYSDCYYEKDNIEVLKNITGMDVVSVINKLETPEEDDFLATAKTEYDQSLKLEKVLNLFR